MDGKSFVEIGVNLTSKAPSECSDNELDEFVDLVTTGGEVVEAGLKERVQDAKALVFLRDEAGCLVGVGALKVPNIAYREKVFVAAKCKENPNHFIYEAGWVFIQKVFRGKGLSKKIVLEVLKSAGSAGVFATTQKNAEHEAMRRTNCRLGFVQAGFPYPTTRPDKKYLLELFVRAPVS